MWSTGYVPAVRHRLSEVARLFTKLGVIGFGGPAAHIALMRDEVVARRRWMDDDEFLDWVGACNLIPGPNSTELAMQLGARRCGWPGLFTAGACFIAPAVVIVGTLAWLYARYGTNPAVLDVRYGVLPVVLAIIAQAVVGLGRTAMKTVLLGLVAVGAFVLFVFDVHELLILAMAGLVPLAWQQRHRFSGGTALLAFPLVAGTDAARDVGLGRLFLVFLEVGALLYGSGYVLAAFLERNLVHELGWLSEQQLLDAVAVGQITPGPLFSTATFVGWQIDGVAGAAVATIGIFLPSFAFVMLLGRVVGWLRENDQARVALDGINVAVVGLMAGVLVELTSTAFPDAFAVAIGALALVALLRWRLNSVWLIATGVAIGLAHGVIS